MTRRILHVDMDEFYAAVEKLDDPSLCGKPLLVGGAPDSRGVVSTASYEARRFGCHSAMPMVTALRLCPHAIVLPVRGRRYAEVSERIFELLGRFTPLVEPLSIDEAFLDVTGCDRLFGGPERIARRVKRAIREETSLTASVGAAPNKFLAKLASDLDKPDGLAVIDASSVRQVLWPLPVSKLWGVGPAGARQFEQLSVRTIGELAQMDVERLVRAFGQTGEHFHRLANGRDDRPVTPDHEAKSISQERTFAVDVCDVGELRRVLLGQVEQVGRRLRRHGLRGRTVTVKLRTGDFTTRTRSASLAQATDVTKEIWDTAERLLEAWSRRSPSPLRLLGVSVSQLRGRGGQQLALFEDPLRARRRRLDRALDGIVERFGAEAIGRGRLPTGRGPAGAQDRPEAEDRHA